MTKSCTTALKLRFVLLYEKMADRNGPLKWSKNLKLVFKNHLDFQKLSLLEYLVMMTIFLRQLDDRICFYYTGYRIWDNIWIRKNEACVDVFKVAVQWESAWDCLQKDHKPS